MGTIWSVVWVSLATMTLHHFLRVGFKYVEIIEMTLSAIQLGTGRKWIYARNSFSLVAKSWCLPCNGPVIIVLSSKVSIVSLVFSLPLSHISSSHFLLFFAEEATSRRRDYGAPSGHYSRGWLGPSGPSWTWHGSYLGLCIGHALPS
jgi:hypothetical protein